MYDYGELQNQLLELYDTQVDNLKNVQIRCDLILIGATMELEKNGIKKTALITVGDFLGDDYSLSKLYDKTFTTEFRKGVTE